MLGRRSPRALRQLRDFDYKATAARSSFLRQLQLSSPTAVLKRQTLWSEAFNAAYVIRHVLSLVVEVSHGEPEQMPGLEIDLKLLVELSIGASISNYRRSTHDMLVGIRRRAIIDDHEGIHLLVTDPCPQTLYPYFHHHGVVWRSRA